MGEHVDLIDRVGRLERQNRRLLGLVLAIPLLMVLLGAAYENVWKGKRVVAEEFFLTDADGKNRGSFTVEKDGPHLILRGPDEKVRVRVSADNEGRGPAVFLVSDKGKVGAVLRLMRGEGGKPYLGLFNDDEKLIFEAGASDANGIGFLQFWDGKGNMKLGLGGSALK